MFRITEDPSSGIIYSANMKFVDAKQAKACYACKNTRLKLLKPNAALWFNKMLMSMETIEPFLNFSQALYKAP